MSARPSHVPSPTVPLVNLGAGSRTTRMGLNMDRGPAYRLHRWGLLSPWSLRCLRPLIGSRRVDRLTPLCAHPLAYADLRQGIPLPDGSVHAVYHCHLLEHLDRPDAARLLSEVHRVLVPGGLHRICVPDLKGKVDRYLSSYAQAASGTITATEHDRRIASLYAQSVRRRSGGDRRPPLQGIGARLRDRCEQWILGDARQRGETHQWMYDAVTLRGALQAAGYTDIRECTAGQSAIADWSDIAQELEWDDQGRPSAPNSLYMEARKPSNS